MIVETLSGPVFGTTIDGISSFLGIPYASPPVGTNRWCAPRAPNPWYEPFVADKFGPGARQTRRPESGFDVECQSEDCLRLNVWKPDDAGDTDLPVIVWIHGGGFEWGASSLPVYCCEKLAARGAVLVSANYRLGPFGTFSHPEQVSPANFSTLDLLAALKWVKANIKAFGGSPARVTIAGQSAGASHVIVLMACPAARDLFQAAIALSPTGLQGFRSTAASFDQVGSLMAKRLGAASSMSALRSRSADAIMAVADKVKADAGFFLWQPVVDGIVVPAPPADVFADGKQAPVPLLIGDTDWEGSDFQDFNSRSMAAALLQITTDQLDQIRETYSAPGNCVTIGDLAAKALFSASVDFLAQCHAAIGAPVWRYRLTHRLADLDRPRGCGHGDDLPLFTGQFGVNGYAKPSQADRAMSERFQSRVISMAANHDPGPDWMRFSQDSHSILGMDNGSEQYVSLEDEHLGSLVALMRAATRDGAADRLADSN